MRLPTKSMTSTALNIRRLPMMAPSAAATPPMPAAMTWKPIMLQTTWLTGRPNSSESETICGNMQTLAMFARTVASINVARTTHPLLSRRVTGTGTATGSVCGPVKLSPWGQVSGGLSEPKSRRLLSHNRRVVT